MPVPNFQDFFGPVLQVTADGAEQARIDLRENVAQALRLTLDHS
ncbi:MAG: hypothetical protein ACR2JB_25040 [Bryobacteraceae bacterium]